ncbi:MAG: replicative DNA helicase [Candidatus Buchananbacteria bacterium]|nr:replicative DNA helicase [Candidatus Buchananbacteria bacterium]
MPDNKKTEKNIAGKLPPQNIEAEQSLLGSLLIDKDAIIKIADIVNANDFYQDKHRLIFEAMLDLYGKREPIDLLTLANRLTEKEQLKETGGRSYLASLSNMVPTSSHVIYYAEIVQKKSSLRNLITAASNITKMGYDEEEDVSSILDKAEQTIFAVSQGHQKQQFVPITNILNDTFERIDAIHKDKGKLRGVPTGFNDLDSLLAGLQKSDLIILAARPSVGKTTFALDIARNVATKNKSPVALFSLEMSKEQLVDRLLCAEANVDLWKMRTGRLSDKQEDDDFPRIGHAMGTLAEAPIFIDDYANANIMEIRTKARRLQMEHDLGLIVIDYLQLMEGRLRTDNRVQEISEISRGLKQIAKELNVPILALSQLNRSVENRQPPIPKLADLRESGSIEQDADIVMFIYRESVYKKDLELDRKNMAEIYISKHRNGPTGVIKLFFDEQKVSFRNLEKSGSNFSEEPPPEPKAKKSDQDLKSQDMQLPNFG